VYMWSTAPDAVGAEENVRRLRSLAEGLTSKVGEAVTAGANEKPRLLAIATYQQRVPKETPRVTPAAPVTVVDAPAATPAPIAAPSAIASSDAAADPAAALPCASDSDAKVDGESFPTAPPLPRMVLVSATPSSSLAFGLDECLSQAERFFSRLCPTARFHAVMQTNHVDDHADHELTLLQQIDEAQQGTTERVDQVEEGDEATHMATTATAPAAPTQAESGSTDASESADEPAAGDTAVAAPPA
jgi:hypothetical protein